METQEVKEPETSSEKELEKKEPDSEQITTTVKQTVPKNPGRIAAGKKLAEHNKKAREAKKKAKADTKIETQKENPPSSEDLKNEQSSSFSLTQVLSVASIAVSVVGLYYKREELKSLFKKNKVETKKAQKELIDHMVEVERQNVTQVPHSGTQQAATKKIPKLKQMD